MTQYNITASNRTITGFNATNDVLAIDQAAGSAAATRVSESGGSTFFTFSNGQVLTLTGVTRGQLTTVNSRFLDGSSFVVGDNTTSAALDEVGNTFTDSTTVNTNDQFLGLGGADTAATNLGRNYVHGGAGNDTVTIGATSTGDTVFGGSDDDNINATAATTGQVLNGGNLNGGGLDGNDVVRGGAGADVINGNQGNDSLDDGSGADTLRGGQGDDNIGVANALAADGIADLIYGDKGNDTITLAAGGGADSVEGGEGNDSITGSNGTAQFITGNAGDDILADGSGTGTVNGGQGNDRITANADTSIDTFNGDKGNDTMTTGAAAGNDIFNGGEGNDSITTTAIGTNTSTLSLFGDAGDDTISVVTGRYGTVNVSGGAGADRFNLVADNANGDTINVLDYVGGTDTLQITTHNATTDAADLTVTSSSSTLTVVNGGQDSVVVSTSGSGSINVLTSTAVASLIAYNLSSTGASITGGAGTDFLVSGDGADTLNTAAGADSFAGGAGNDSIVINAAGADSGDAGTGTDVVEVALTSQVVFGNTQIRGAESIKFTGTSGSADLAGAATYIGNGSDVVASTIVTVDGSATTAGLTIVTTNDFGARLNITGGSGDESVVLTNTTTAATIDGGTGGNDTLTGGAGSDSIVGGAGADSLSGANGDDTMYGGAGADFFNTGGQTVADIVKVATGDSAADPTAGSQIDVLGTWTFGTDKIMFQPIASGGTGWTFGYNANTTADITLAAVTALNSTANSVLVVNLGNASQTGITGLVGGVTAAQNDDVIVINNGTNKFAIYVDGTQDLSTFAAYTNIFQDFA